MAGIPAVSGGVMDASGVSGRVAGTVEHML